MQTQPSQPLQQLQPLIKSTATRIDLGYGMTLSQVPGCSRLFTITGPNTQTLGWRAVYIGYSRPQELFRWNMSRYRAMVPGDQVSERPANRLAQFGFERELKISNRLNPSIFWGQQGKELLRELAVFLESPAAAKALPKRRTVIFPFVVGSVLQVWINGSYAVSMVDNAENRDFITALQAHPELKPAVIVAHVRSFSLPDIAN